MGNGGVITIVKECIEIIIVLIRSIDALHLLTTFPNARLLIVGEVEYAAGG